MLPTSYILLVQTTYDIRKEKQATRPNGFRWIEVLESLHWNCIFFDASGIESNSWKRNRIDRLHDQRWARVKRYQWLDKSHPRCYGSESEVYCTMLLQLQLISIDIPQGCLLRVQLFSILILYVENHHEELAHFYQCYPHSDWRLLYPAVDRYFWVVNFYHRWNGDTDCIRSAIWVIVPDDRYDDDGGLWRYNAVNNHGQIDSHIRSYSRNHTYHIDCQYIQRSQTPWAKWIESNWQNSKISKSS